MINFLELSFSIAQNHVHNYRRANHGDGSREIRNHDKYCLLASSKEGLLLSDNIAICLCNIIMLCHCDISCFAAGQNDCVDKSNFCGWVEFVLYFGGIRRVSFTSCCCLDFILLRLVRSLCCCGCSSLPDEEAACGRRRFLQAAPMNESVGAPNDDLKLVAEEERQRRSYHTSVLYHKKLKQWELELAK